jgi:hypothetical protein
MDSETKLIPCFRVGKRNFTNTWYFVQDLESRMAGRVQLTTDGFFIGPPSGFSFAGLVHDRNDRFGCKMHDQQSFVV